MTMEQMECKVSRVPRDQPVPIQPFLVPKVLRDLRVIPAHLALTALRDFRASKVPRE